jgi:hypothetical protein
LSGYGPVKTIRAQLDVTAASGTTPTSDVVVKDSVDGGTNWNTVPRSHRRPRVGAR